LKAVFFKTSTSTILITEHNAKTLILSDPHANCGYRFFLIPINKNNLLKARRHNTFFLLQRRYGKVTVKVNKKKSLNSYAIHHNLQSHMRIGKNWGFLR
jgi:hypothetical protein